MIIVSVSRIAHISLGERVETLSIIALNAKHCQRDEKRRDNERINRNLFPKQVMTF